jgi:hypothetical protein
MDYVDRIYNIYIYDGYNYDVYFGGMIAALLSIHTV